jgi:hypothetical protein
MRLATFLVVFAYLTIGILPVRSASLEDLSKDEFESVEFRDRLTEVVQLLRVSDAIYVGPGIDKKRITLKVVKESAIRDLGVLDLSMNAIAIKPNRIVVSELLVATMFVDAFNSTLAYTYAVTKGNDPIVDSKIFAIRRMHLLRELERGYTASGENVISEAKSLMKVAGLTHSDAIKFVFAGSFSQLLFHELAHLSNFKFDVQSSGLFDVVNQFLKRLQAGRILEEEVRADTVAAQNVLEIISSLRQQSQNQLNKILFIQGLESYLFIMRDLIFKDLLAGQRNLGAEDFLIRMVHASCLENKAALRFDYTHPDRVVLGADTHLPILTGNEYATLVERLGGTNAYHTHPHNFERTLELLNLIDEQEFHSHFNVQEGISLLKMARDGLAADFRRAPLTKAGLPWGITDSVETLSKVFKLEDGKLCPGTKCWAGYPKNREFKGFSEIVANGDSVKSIRFALPIGTAGKGTLRFDVALMQSVVIFQALKLSDDQILSLGGARVNFVQCGIGSYLLNESNLIVSADTTIDDGYIVYDFLPVDSGKSLFENWRGPY